MLLPAAPFVFVIVPPLPPVVAGVEPAADPVAEPVPEDGEGDELGDEDPPLVTPVIDTGWPAATQP